MVDLVLSRPGMLTRHESHWSKVPPLGIGYLASAAREKGLSVAIVDGKLSKHITNDQSVNEILKYHPKVLGISMLTTDYYGAARIASKIKKQLPDVTIVIGGAHVNALPRESLAQCKHFDYALQGEAENSLPALIKGIKSGNREAEIGGVYSSGENSEIQIPSIPIDNPCLEDLPFPAWDLFPRVSIYPMMTERGCPFNCVFCSHNLSRRIKSRSVEHVMEEIKWLDKNFSPQKIYFEDETFGLNKRRTFELLEKICAYNNNGIIKFKAQTRIDYISKPLLDLMKRAGFEFLEIGIESGDAAVLANSGKGIDLEQIEKNVSLIDESGIKSWLNFIIGLPGETKKSVRNSIKLAAKLNPNRLSAAIIVAYPGTQIYKWANENQKGYRLLSRDWQRFDKYLNSSVELDTLSYRTMRYLQLRMYIETYARNFRIKELVKLFWRHRSFINPITKSLFQKQKNND